MITDDGKKWHYLTVKSISALLRGITSNHDRDFYCLNCLHSYRTKGILKKHEKVCNDHDHCYVKMPNEHEKILKYNQGEKSLKVLFMIYADLECLLRKIDSCQIKMIQKNLLQKKELSMSLLVTHGLHAVHLMNQKTNGIITEEKTVWKCFVKI